MKQLISIVIAIMLLSSCSREAGDLKERITGTDSVAINYFKGDGTMDTVVAVKIIRDKANISQLVDLITASATSAKDKCGADGSLHFFKTNMVIQDIDFRTGADCKQFSFSLNGKRSASKLSGEAAALLADIKSGRRK